MYWYENVTNQKWSQRKEIGATEEIQCYLWFEPGESTVLCTLNFFVRFHLEVPVLKGAIYFLPLQ